MANKTGLPVIYLMGPTASGKTELAVDLVREHPFEIISVDSAMVYRGLDIGTAKPTAEQQHEAPHHLIDICDPAEAYSAARFRADAEGLIGAIHRRGRIPLLVGGTGLYFRSLEQGLTALPAADPAVRRELEEEAEIVGWEGLHERLQRIDPEAAVRIHPNDPHRIQRALEVYATSGVPLSEHFAGKTEIPMSHELIKVMICPQDRQDIRTAVEQRFQHMLEAGFEREVRGLYQRNDLHAALPSMRLVGYRQMWQYLEGELDYDTMREHAIVATRQLAKRQLTWFRRETGGRWFDSRDRQSRHKILKYLAENPNLAAIM